jgi:hypothetical protein
MSDLIDVPDEAVRLVQAALIDCHHGSNCRDTAHNAFCWPADQTARAILLAVLPVLRAQIEAETRAKIADEITAWRDADADERESDIRCPAEGHDCHGAAAYSAYTLAARLARGETNG